MIVTIAGNNGDESSAHKLPVVALVKFVEFQSLVEYVGNQFETSFVVEHLTIFLG